MDFALQKETEHYFCWKDTAAQEIRVDKENNFSSNRNYNCDISICAEKGRILKTLLICFELKNGTHSY